MDHLGISAELSRIPDVLVFLTTFSLVYLLVDRVSRHLKPDSRKYPPSVGCLPIIGSLPYLPNVRNIHHWCLEKSYKHGAVFTAKVGNTYVVFLNSHEAIREAFTKRSSDFADRIKHFIDPIINPNGKGIIFHKYDEEYKKYQQVSLSVLKEFGFGQNMIETRIHMEVEELISTIKEINGQPFYPREKVIFAIQGVISRILYGNPEGTLKKDVFKSHALILELPKQFMNLVVLDLLPSLRFIPYIHKYINKVKMVQSKIFELLSKQIDHCLQPDAEESFVRSFVEKGGKDFDKGQLMVTMRDLVIAGIDTITGSMMWAVLLLANHPKVQDRLQKEMDSVVPRDRLPSLDDASKMTYVEATILEMLRHKTVLPFGAPRATLRDTQVGGYFIPKKSQVYTMLHTIHMDVNIWTDPEVFRPERFLDPAGNIINKDLVIPFSIGKRSCLGESLARQEVFLFLTGLVQQFNIRPPEGSNKIEYKENMDAILSPKPYQVRFLTRD